MTSRVSNGVDREKGRESAAESDSRERYAATDPFAAGKRALDPIGFVHLVDGWPFDGIVGRPSSPGSVFSSS